MASPAASFVAECTAPQPFLDFNIDIDTFTQPSSCQNMLPASGSYLEEEADFLSELLAQQDNAGSSVHPFMGDSSESSGMQAAMSESSTTFGDLDTDGVVPITDHGSSPVSSLLVPVNPTSLMLQLDYSDVISTWEEMTADERHPISHFTDQHANSDQLIALQSPLQSSCMYNLPQPSMAIMDATLNLNLDLSPASIPSFASFSGVSVSHPQQHPQQPPQYQLVRQASQTSSPGSLVGCMESVTGAPVQQQQPACAPRTAAEKSASLERYREKKATRQCGSSKIRYQIRKTNADNRPRFKGCFVKPSRLAELQMEAALNGESYLPSSPMISGGSSDSTFAGCTLNSHMPHVAQSL